jgi:hypothetical protein
MLIGVFIGIFIAKAFDIAAIISITGGLFAKNYWQAILVGIVAAILGEVLLSSVAPTYRLNAVSLLLGVAAQVGWACLVLAIRRKLRGKRQLEA